MTPTQKATAIRLALREAPACPVEDREISEAAYTLSEGGRWPDAVDSVSVDQILVCWQLVEWIRDNGDKLPDEYRL